MASNEEVERELTQLRSNADNLSQCLHALLQRIELLEGAGGPDAGALQSLVKNGVTAVTMTNGEPEPSSDVQVVQSEEVSVDPVTGLKKKTIVTERVLTTRTFHAVPKSLRSFSPEASERFDAHCSANFVNGNRRLLGRAYEARVTEVSAEHLRNLQVKFVRGEMVVTRVTPEVAHLVKPGDTIREVNGKPARTLKDLYAQAGLVRLKVVLSDLYSSPPEFVKVLGNYDSAEDNQQPTSSLPPLAVRKGDVLQVLSRDAAWLQVRKVNDLSQCAFLPASLPVDPVALMTPYGRRTLVLLGAKGVGRRTLKGMLLAEMPGFFSTVVPVTSRARRASEQEGREYHFETREAILQKIRDGEMIEWGELDGVLYGTSADSVRTVMRSGRVCVLDCSVKALDYLYNAEFMPYVVLVGPPALEELRQMAELRNESDQSTETRLRATVQQHEELLGSRCIKFVDQILINRNHDVTLRRLIEAMEHLKENPQWVPSDWMSGKVMFQRV